MNTNRQVQTLRGIQTTKDTLNTAIKKAQDDAITQLLQLLESAMKPDEGTPTTTAPSAAINQE